MNETYFYKAFGLTIESCSPIAQLPAIAPCNADVRIVWADFSDLTADERQYTNASGNFFRGHDNCRHRITGGNLIEVERLEDFQESQLGVYLMGSCMGAILMQRGFMLLHGSCVTNGERAILITGDSGAGKSTGSQVASMRITWSGSTARILSYAVSYISHSCSLSCLSESPEL